MSIDISTTNPGERVSVTLGDARLPKRFWTKVRVDENGCWRWLASVTDRGYANFDFNGGKRRAHRVSYQELVGPIPDGLVVDHLCRVRDCVNPAHLEAVTIWENTLRSTSPTAELSRRTHCPKGHPLSGSNLAAYRLKLDGRRNCKTCNRDRTRRWRESKRRAA